MCYSCDYTLWGPVVKKKTLTPEQREKLLKLLGMDDVTVQEVCEIVGVVR